MTDAEIERRLSDCPLNGGGGAFAAGTLFGDWRITAFIAKGGTAEVYCAVHSTLGTPAAVKVLAEPLTDARKSRFVREAKLLADLASPAFPAFHGYGEANGRPYLAEELLEPGELPKGDGPRARYLQALCQGLGVLHARGVVHRDLKPANILFRQGGEPVIVDLGLAKSADVPLVPDGVSVVDGHAVGVGTPEYAAPEQFTGGDITPAADVHALGVLAEKLMQGEGGAFSTSGWRRIIRRATSSIASERYQSVEAFAAAVRRRHWLRNGIVAVVSCLCAAGLALAVRALSPASVDPFTARFEYGGQVDGRRVYDLNLEGRTVRVGGAQATRLQGPARYRICGPGTLSANVVGRGDVEIEVGRAGFYNETTTPLRDSSIRYRLTGNALMAFPNLRNEADSDRLIVPPGFNRAYFGRAQGE